MKTITAACVVLALMAGPASARPLLVPAFDISVDYIDKSGFRGRLATDVGPFKRGDRLTSHPVDIGQSFATLCLNHVYANDFEMIPTTGGDCLATGFVPILIDQEGTISVDNAKIYREEFIIMGVARKYEGDFGFRRD